MHMLGGAVTARRPLWSVHHELWGEKQRFWRRPNWGFCVGGLQQQRRQGGSTSGGSARGQLASCCKPAVGAPWTGSIQSAGRHPARWLFFRNPAERMGRADTQLAAGRVAPSDEREEVCSKPSRIATHACSWQILMYLFPSAAFLWVVVTLAATLFVLAVSIVYLMIQEKVCDVDLPPADALPACRSRRASRPGAPVLFRRHVR